MPIRNRFAELLPEITAWRQDLHRHPELEFDTHRTAALVADALRAFGCDDVVTGIGQTGVVGLIRGRAAGKRCIGLRADMDALPIKEATGLSYASSEPGKMHACGHDGHTAMLLGAAKYLAETRAFAGTVAVIFQPAEESGGGGREMVRDGFLDRFGIDEVYGMHNWPGLEIGAFGIRTGNFLAASDVFEIEVHGPGCHAGEPHEGVDMPLAAAHIVTALQSITSRNVHPAKQAVVSVTSLQTDGDAYNILPNRVMLKGTVRTFEPEVQDLVHTRLETIARAAATALGADARVTYTRNYPATVNAPDQTGYAADAARKVSAQVDTEAELTMGAEDFAFMLNERPGAYILIGNGGSAPVHHPAYDFNDAAIPAGCSFWVELAEARLPLVG
jgi:hippurate hydrolase